MYGPDLKRALRTNIRIRHDFEVPPNWLAPRVLRIPLPLDYVYETLYIRIVGILTIAGAIATALQANAMRRIIRGLRIVCGMPSNDIDVRNYSAFGVNDGVAGRTASYAGEQIAAEALADQGAPIFQVDPGLAIAAHPVEVTFPIRFTRLHGARRYATLLEARRAAGIRHLTLEVTLGIADTTAAADDTDILVNPALGTNALVAAVEISADVWQNVPAYPFDLRTILTRQLALGVQADLPLDFGLGGYYNRLTMLCSDNDVASDALIASMWFRLGDTTEITRGTWGDYRNQALQRYSLAAIPAGYNYVDFDPEKSGSKVNANGFPSAQLHCEVPAGAVIAQDRLWVAHEQVVLNPLGRSEPGEASEGVARRIRRRRGRAA